MTGTSASRSTSRPFPAHPRLRRTATWLAAGGAALATVGLTAVGTAQAAPASPVAANYVSIRAVAPIPGTKADFGFGYNNSYKPVVWRYSGSAWKSVKFDTSSTITFTGVAAASSSKAWLVGQMESGETTNGVVEAWNGSSFKKSQTLKGEALDGVVASAKSAWAWGNGTGSSLFLEHWNGKSWSKASTSGVAVDNAFVTMATDSRATFALAEDVSTGGFSLLRWSGGKWTSTALPKFATYQTVEGLTASGSSAFAIGYGTSASTQKGVVLRWNGKWTTYQLAKSVLATSVGAGGGHVWVGAERTTGELTAVGQVLRYTGHSFVTVATAHSTAKFSDITSIAANSATDVLATGGAGATGCDVTAALIERLNGSRWSQGGTVPQFATAGVAPHC